jgi:NTE family protein
MNNFDFENLAFEGGGVKGLAYVGCLKALNDIDKLKNVKRVVSTSVGSIFALLTVLKCDNDEIDKYVNEFWLEITGLNDNIITEIENLVEHIGLHDNINIYNVVNKLLFQKFKKENMTMVELYEKTDVELTVVGTCLSTRETIYFNYKTYPNMEVSKAIQISTSIPLFYVVTKWDNQVWCDGGVSDCFPIDYFDSNDGTFNKNTLGFYLEYDDGKKDIYKISNILNLLENIEYTELDSNVSKSIANTKNRFIVDINTGKISSLDYKLTDKQKKFLIDNGYNSTREFFSYDKVKLNNKDKSDSSFYWKVLGYFKFW